MHYFWYPHKIHTHNMRSAGLQDYRVYLTMKLQFQKVMRWCTRHRPMSIEIINAWWHQVDAYNYVKILFVWDVRKIKSSKTSFWDNKFINITLSPRDPRTKPDWSRTERFGPGPWKFKTWDRNGPGPTKIWKSRTDSDQSLHGPLIPVVTNKSVAAQMIVRQKGSLLGMPMFDKT